MERNRNKGYRRARKSLATTGGSIVVLPSLDNVVNLNRLHLGRTKDQPNEFLVCHKSRLEWVLDAVRHPLIGFEPYPDIVDKVCIIVWSIVRGHVFFDGNKRTGISVLLIMLEANGFRLRADNNEHIDLAIKVADGQSGFTLYDLRAWISDRISPVSREST